MDNHIGDTTEMMRPRICEVLGVEVGEWFTYPGMSTSFQVTENGFLKCADGDLKMSFREISEEEFMAEFDRYAKELRDTLLIGNSTMEEQE